MAKTIKFKAKPTTVEEDFTKLLLTMKKAIGETRLRVLIEKALRQRK